MAAEGPSLESLPEEMRQEIISFLPPEGLGLLRSTSTTLRNSIDSYVQHLMDSAQLTDLSGRPVTGETPADALAGWGSGRYGTDSFPARVVPLDSQEVLDHFNGVLTSVYEADQNYQLSMIENVYDRLMNEGGPRALEIRDELETYTTLKLRLGEVQQRAGGDQPWGPVDPNATPDQVLNGIRGGHMRFTKPA